MAAVQSRDDRSTDGRGNIDDQMAGLVKKDSSGRSKHDNNWHTLKAAVARVAGGIA